MRGPKQKYSYMTLTVILLWPPPRLFGFALLAGDGVEEGKAIGRSVAGNVVPAFGNGQ